MHSREFPLQKNTSLVDLVRFPLPVRVEGEAPADFLVSAVLSGESAADSSNTRPVQEDDLALTDYPEEVPKLLQVLNRARSAVALDG
ncbi:hypothetical protein OTU49_005356, partial [Cherax quadricarinatus]